MVVPRVMFSFPLSCHRDQLLPHFNSSGRPVVWSYGRVTSDGTGGVIMQLDGKGSSPLRMDGTECKKMLSPMLDCVTY